MKGRTGSAGVETTHEVPAQRGHSEQVRSRQSFGSTHSRFQRRTSMGRPAIIIAGLAVAFLVGILFVGYGSKFYQNWRERHLLYRATALLQEGKVSKAADMAQEVTRRHPNSLAALSILADTA